MNKPTPTNAAGVFRSAPNELRRVYLPWRETIRMCWASVRNRKGRFLLVFIGIAVVVAFLMSSFSSNQIMMDLSKIKDVHVQAVLENAGFFAHDTEAMRERHDRRVWLMALSSILCLFGITNTMLMSVTERVGEIGTLKCLGALDRYVVRLILIESIFIGLLGSLAGALCGFILTILQLGFSLEFGILFSEPVLVAPLIYGIPSAVGAGAVLTVLAAIYPTYVAARMEPVEAMRAEF